MKVAFIAPDDLSTLIFCKTFVRVLHELGNMQIFTISPIDKYRDEIEELHTTHIELSMKRYIHPVADVKYFFDLSHIMRREMFDIVVTFTTKPNVYAVVAAKIAGVPNITMAVRGLGRIFCNPRGVKEKFLLAIMTRLYRYACQRSDHVWFTNHHDCDYFTSNKIAQKRKTFLTKNAVNLQEFSWDSLPMGGIEVLRAELNLTPNDMTVIMVARLIWAKGIKEFAEAAEILKVRYPNLHFLLVAPYEHNSPGAVPKSYVASMERKSNLKWLGFRKDVKALYALSDLAVLPSYYQEGGYPRALLEAMAYAKPVIAADTDVCRGPVVVGKNGYLVPVKNSNALAKAIEAIISNKDCRKAFGAYSLKIMQREFDDRVVINDVLTEIGIIPRRSNVTKPKDSVQDDCRFS